MRAQRKLISFIGLGSHTAAPLLYSYLKEHPQVNVSEGMADFFSDTKKYAKGITWYESQLDTNIKNTINGELAHNYISSTQAAGLIRRIYPSAKLLAVIENPLVSVRVDYVEARRAGKISRDITLAMFLKQSPEVLLRAKYGRHLVHYFSYYSQNDLLVVLASDVRNEALKTVELTFTHLGLDSKYVPLPIRHLLPEEEIDPKKRPGIIKCSFRFIKHLPVRIFKAIMPKKKEQIVSTETATVVARRIELSPELEKFLKDYYREDVKQLSSLLHRDLLVEWDF